MEFNPRADKRTLIRRLYLVMHGLPPSPEEVERLSMIPQTTRTPSWSTRCWPARVMGAMGDALAGSVRFGESHGFETNRERVHAWPYRDWVIRALNEDKPYNQFVREQLAGDALANPSARAS